VVALATGTLATALGNVVSSLGLISMLFYGLTGAAAVWQNRGRLLLSPEDFLLSGLLPGIGTLFMIWVAFESVHSGAATRTILIYGAGSVAVGALIAVYLRCCGNIPFFRAEPLP
jgi:hypothetical protein